MTQILADSTELVTSENHTYIFDIFELNWWLCVTTAPLWLYEWLNNFKKYTYLLGVFAFLCTDINSIINTTNQVNIEQKYFKIIIFKQTAQFILFLIKKKNCYTSKLRCWCFFKDNLDNSSKWVVHIVSKCIYLAWRN